MTWARWIETNRQARIVKQEMVGNYFVSTVFLGLDHGFGGGPLWFETMVFLGAGTEDFSERYETWDEAVAGHERAVALYRNKP
jgi:hypothetical protein